MITLNHYYLVRTDDNWEDWDVKAFIDALKKWLKRKKRQRSAREILTKHPLISLSRNGIFPRHLKTVTDTRSIGSLRKAEERTQWTAKEAEERLCVCIARRIIGRELYNLQHLEDSQGSSS